MRKLIILAVGGAAVAYVLKSRGEQSVATPSPAPGPTGQAPPVDTTADTVESDALPADARFDQTEGAPTGEGVVPDTSDDDPLVRQQEDAAAAEAGSVGGDADTATADVEPEMRPVVEGSGDAEETFEQTEDEGR